MNLIKLTEAGSFRKERNSGTDTSVWIRSWRDVSLPEFR